MAERNAGDSLDRDIWFDDRPLTPPADRGDPRFEACRREQQAKAEALDRLRADLADVARLQGMTEVGHGDYVLECPHCMQRLQLSVDSLPSNRAVFRGDRSCDSLRRIKDAIRDQLAGRGHRAVEVN